MVGDKIEKVDNTQQRLDVRDTVILPTNGVLEMEESRAYALGGIDSSLEQMRVSSLHLVEDSVRDNVE
jgi:hypothetical protein